MQRAMQHATCDTTCNVRCNMRCNMQRAVQHATCDATCGTGPPQLTRCRRRSDDAVRTGGADGLGYSGYSLAGGAGRAGGARPSRSSWPSSAWLRSLQRRKAPRRRMTRSADGPAAVSAFGRSAARSDRSGGAVCRWPCAQTFIHSETVPVRYTRVLTRTDAAAAAAAAAGPTAN
jgi:hypothetical protein